MEKEFPSSCHSHHSLKKGEKGPLKPLVWDFKELGRNGTSGKWECDLHGKSLQRYLPLHRSLCPRLLEVQPCGSGFLLENAANKHSTSRDRWLCLCKKDNRCTFKPRGWEQGLQFELHVWKLNIAQSINYLTDSAAGRAGDAGQVSDMKLSVHLLTNAKKCAPDLLEREIVLPGWRTQESSR